MTLGMESVGETSTYIIIGTTTGCHQCPLRGVGGDEEVARRHHEHESREEDDGGQAVARSYLSNTVVSIE